MRKLVMVLLLCAGIAEAGDKPGVFDYYVLALSWSPTWCALEGDARRAPQCRASKDYGWVLHGLWPQYERGYPEHCQTTARAPSRRQTAEMADIMGSSGLAWYQWKKHGSCSGLSSADYYALARKAFESIQRPQILRRLDRPVTLKATVIETAFLEANRQLSRDMITITCRQGRIQEARICLSKSLEPRRCGSDVRRDCTLPNALLDPVR